jgi:hypothetical protein
MGKLLNAHPQPQVSPSLLTRCYEAMEDGKRERDLPTITYTAGTRSFERLFKGKYALSDRLEVGGIVLMSLFTETSLEEIRDVVRRKLQLPPNSTVKLKQLRGLKQAIDLDDGKLRRL